MIYKGVDYTVAPTATPWVWKWQFRIGDEVKTGKTQTKIECLAMRRADSKLIANCSSLAEHRPPQLAASFISSGAPQITSRNCMRSLPISKMS
jgi:hypothetical protein